ncbi:hypothetical protein AR689_00085 [Arthrobacter sp. EpRS71]|nr:hypothetical protein AR689_00085 [Arthrobacter sp. EpRS71]
MIMAGELVVKVVRYRSMEVASDAIGLIVVAGAVGLGFGILPAGRELAPLDLLPGAAILLGVWLSWLIFRQVEARRTHG